MPDATGLRGLLMSARSMRGNKQSSQDTNLPDENPKRKKKFLDRFVEKGSQADKMRGGFEMLRNLGKK